MNFLLLARNMCNSMIVPPHHKMGWKATRREGRRENAKNEQNAGYLMLKRRKEKRGRQEKDEEGDENSRWSHSVPYLS
ncbi:hypothetical protein VTL71DRAFT_4033 [Oculimacula yallundae]|uniref:Alternative oxidase n=1 Tax=Oculimacula yallundae TaxID=86028 RepID=A0ABR4C4N8_9HELO